MVKTTFKNLTAEKKQRVTAALLTEFSQYQLKDAKVARIVKNAGIARGAFYKYFADLTDAYTYLYGLALRKIHTDVRISPTEFSPANFYEQVVDFLNQTECSEYSALIKLHLLYNENELPQSDQAAVKTRQLAPEVWAAMVLSHEVIKLVFADPASKAASLARFKESLMILKEGKR